MSEHQTVGNRDVTVYGRSVDANESVRGGQVPYSNLVPRQAAPGPALSSSRLRGKLLKCMGHIWATHLGHIWATGRSRESLGPPASPLTSPVGDGAKTNYLFIRGDQRQCHPTSSRFMNYEVRSTNAQSQHGHTHQVYRLVALFQC